MAAIVLVLMTVHIYLVSTYYEMYEIEIRFHIFWTYKNFNGFFFCCDRFYFVLLSFYRRRSSLVCKPPVAENTATAVYVVERHIFPLDSATTIFCGKLHEGSGIF